LAPYTIAAHGLNGICGLNTVGLRRAGYTSDQRQSLKGLYRKLFLDGKNITEVVEAALMDSPDEQERTMLEFIAASKRGVCGHVGRKANDD
jgi:UDP-N-acetylglucosamine acyltransferase